MRQSFPNFSTFFYCPSTAIYFQIPIPKETNSCERRQVMWRVVGGKGPEYYWLYELCRMPRPGLAQSSVIDQRVRLRGRSQTDVRSRTETLRYVALELLFLINQFSFNADPYFNKRRCEVSRRSYWLWFIVLDRKRGEKSGIVCTQQHSWARRY